MARNAMMPFNLYTAQKLLLILFTLFKGYSIDHFSPLTSKHHVVTL